MGSHTTVTESLGQSKYHRTFETYETAILMPTPTDEYNKDE